MGQNITVSHFVGLLETGMHAPIVFASQSGYILCLPTSAPDFFVCCPKFPKSLFFQCLRYLLQLGE